MVSKSLIEFQDATVVYDWSQCMPYFMREISMLGHALYFFTIPELMSRLRRIYHTAGRTDAYLDNILL